ncbi:MAG: MFS transporter [Vicinamibacteraceae bacterium]
MTGTRSRGQTLAAVTAFVSLFAIVGLALYGLPFFYDFMVKEYGWTRAQVTSGNAYSKLVIGPLFGFFAGWFVDRFGSRKLMIVGILLAGLAPIGLGAMTSLAMFYTFYLCNALGYVLGGPLPNQVLLSRWFDAGRGRAMGFAYLGIGVGGALVPLIAHALEVRFGWHTALQLLGVMMIAVALPLIWVVKDAPVFAAETGAPASRPGAGGHAPAGAASIAAAGSRPRIWTDWTFPLLLVGSMCSIGAVGGTMQNLKLFLTLDKAITQGDVAGVLSLVLVGSIGGRLLMGVLADMFPKKFVMLAIYALVALTVPLLYAAPSLGTLRLAAIAFGVGLGGDYMIIPLMAAELYGLARLGRVMGVVLTADGVAEALVPMGVGALRDHYGSYGPGFALLLGLAVVGAVAVAALPRTLLVTRRPSGDPAADAPA